MKRRGQGRRWNLMWGRKNCDIYVRFVGVNISDLGSSPRGNEWSL